MFLAQLPGGAVVVDIVDPHGIQFADPGVYRRIECVAESGGRLRRLDLTRAEVRKAVAEAKDAKSLYESASANDYK